jgi:phosphoribosyl 1,2-cyclic phosphate phosphodiesterase
VTITFLGTGTSQGIPVIACDCEVCTSLDFRDKRTRTSVHVETDDLSLVIDTGPDFRQQMLRERIKRVDAIVYTHEHKDHTAGMDDIRAYNFKQGGEMPLYAHDRVIEQLKQEFSYAFAEHKYPGVPQIVTNRISEEPFDIHGVEIIPLQVYHYKLPVFGFRIGDFCYITDANSISDEAYARMEGARVLVLNALQKKDHISHFNLEQALEVAEKVGADNTYFTHISHRMGTHKETIDLLPEQVEIAYDGLKVSL